MTVRGKPYVHHPNALRRKVLHEVATQEKSIAIIAELNGLAAATVCAWVRQAGLDRGRPAYTRRRDNDGRQVKLPSGPQLAAANRLLNTWRLK